MSLAPFPAHAMPPGPQLPSTGDSSPVLVIPPSAGAGNHLPVWLLALCATFTAVATIISVMSIVLQLKNYRKPVLQRFVVRIMVMVPLYAISSLIALFSLNAAFFIDAVRDLYEAFVIYAFLQLLITYLGGERSLLITLHGRPPIPHPFPISLFIKPMDPSDPWTLLNLKRGVLQYVQVKPILVLATIILKLTGTFHEGEFTSSSGYTYISVVYNISICLSLYCLAMFWVAVDKDLKPFRPVPKFLCVKGILFFCFWQSVFISLLVAVGAIKQVGPYTDAEHMSLALVDSLICFEMPIFAIAHQYAFQASDYIDHSIVYAARLPFIYAFRDAFGIKDVWEDSKDTIKGRGISYQAYEPAEGGLHYGLGRQRRIRAGLRYAKGGQTKYWIPIPGDPARSRGETGPISAIKRKIDASLAARQGYAPLLPQQAAHVVHEDDSRSSHDHRSNDNYGGAHDERGGVERNRRQFGAADNVNGMNGSSTIYVSKGDADSDDSDAASLGFDSISEDEDAMYERARRIGYAGFPNVDVSREAARRKRWEEEEAILTGRVPGRAGQVDRGKGRTRGKPGVKENKSKMGIYGAWADSISPVDAQNTGATSRGSVSPQDEDDDSGNQRQDSNLLSRPIPPANRRRSSPSRPGGKQGAGNTKTARSGISRSSFTLGEDDGDSDADDERERNGKGVGIGFGSDRKRGGKVDGGEIDAGGKVGERKSLPSDAIDLVVEDFQAVERARERERRKGEPQTNAPAHVYRHLATGTISPSALAAGLERRDNEDVEGENKNLLSVGNSGGIGGGGRDGEGFQAIERVYSPRPDMGDVRGRVEVVVVDQNNAGDEDGVEVIGVGVGKAGMHGGGGAAADQGEGWGDSWRGEISGGEGSGRRGTRTETPPIHARFGTSHEENPWT